MTDITEKPYPKAFDFLVRAAQDAAPTAVCSFPTPEAIAITVGAKRVLIPLSRSWIADLERALDADMPVPYANGMKSDIQFNLYVALGQEEMLPLDFRLSDFFLNGLKRDWHTQCSLDVQLKADVASDLYDGLKRLQRTLERTLKSGAVMPEVEQELATLRSLTEKYEEHRHLNSGDASAESLSYLKAAAVVQILDLERKRDAEAVPRVKAAHMKRILEIAAPFQVQPYNRIKLAPALSDYVAREKSAVDSSQRGLREHADVETLLQRVDPRLRDQWVGAWQALESDNADVVIQAANSMVDVLDQIIKHVVGAATFEAYLSSRYPGQADMVMAQRKWVAEVKSGVHEVKHQTAAQTTQLGEDVMRAAEVIIRMLLR